MPYIDAEKRDELMGDTSTRVPETAGELNFLITSLVDEYILNSGGVKYKVINEAVGVLECAKLELYRRLAAPYEDQKCFDNGDVYQNAQ